MFRLGFTGVFATGLGIFLFVKSFFADGKDAQIFGIIGANMFMAGVICLVIWFFIRRRWS